MKSAKSLKICAIHAVRAAKTDAKNSKLLPSHCIKNVYTQTGKYK